jgi:hypothetical protein
MTFSPEDAYANNVPVPDEDQFDTGGLELEPLGGDEDEAGPLDGYTAEEQAADAALYRVNSELPQTEMLVETEPVATTEVVAEAVGAESNAEDTETVLGYLNNLYTEAKNVREYGGVINSNLVSETRGMLEGLSETAQEQAADKFFDSTIGKDISTNRDAYIIYASFRGTAFSNRFQQLEDSRLKSAGYSGFRL